MKKIIITAGVHEILPETFIAKGYEVIYRPEITYEELLTIVHEAFGLVITTRIKVDKKMLDAATSLQWVGRLGSGLELIDTAYATSKGIKFYSTPEGNCTAVGEQALLMLLALKRNLVKAATEVKEKIWLRNENRGHEITGLTIGIVGYGHTGSAFAEVLKGFNPKILAHDKYKSGFGNDYVTEASLQELMESADVISFHLPLTPETRHYANEAFFANMQQKPLILNTSRGSVIETKGLLSALQNNLISAAGLDVLENEKLNSYTGEEDDIFQKLKNMPNVLLTPHIAGYTYEAYFKMSNFLIDKLNLDFDK